MANELFVQGLATSGAAKSGNPIQIGFVFNTTQPTVTTGQEVEAQGTARGAAIVATGVDTFNVTVSAALPAGSNTIGTVAVGSDVVTSFSVGNKSAIAASAVQMTTSSTAATKGVVVKADPGNGAKVAVGAGSGVTYNAVDATDGYVLSAGDSVTVPVDNANKVYVIGSVASPTQRVSFMVA